MAGTAVLRIVVSSDSIKKATATSHGKSRLAASEGLDKEGDQWAVLVHLKASARGFCSPNMLADVSDFIEIRRDVGVLDHLARLHNVALSPYNRGR